MKDGGLSYDCFNGRVYGLSEEWVRAKKPVRGVDSFLSR